MSIKTQHKSRPQMQKYYILTLLKNLMLSKLIQCYMYMIEY